MQTTHIMFKVKHLKLSMVTGIFKKFDATLELNEEGQFFI
jgi:polyisoprenoid-binding protein YceI